MKIIVDGTAYSGDPTKRPNNKTVMAFEDAMGCTFSSWGIRVGKRWKEIRLAIEDATKAAPEGSEPDLSEVDVSLPMRDLTALVFMARRNAGEMVKFDDVEFTEVAFEAEDGDPTEGDEETPPDRDADPTAGSTTTSVEPTDESSPQNA